MPLEYRERRRLHEGAQARRLRHSHEVALARAS